MTFPFLTQAILTSLEILAEVLNKILETITMQMILVEISEETLVIMAMILEEILVVIMVMISEVILGVILVVLANKNKKKYNK